MPKHYGCYGFLYTNVPQRIRTSHLVGHKRRNVAWVLPHTSGGERVTNLQAGTCFVKPFRYVLHTCYRQRRHHLRDILLKWCWPTAGLLARDSPPHRRKGTPLERGAGVPADTSHLGTSCRHRG